MELTDHLGAMWRRRWVILLLSLAVAALVFARSSFLLDPVYSSEAQLTVSAADPAASLDQLGFVVQSYVDLATTAPVINDAIERSGLTLDVGEARNRISVASSETGGLIRVSASGPTTEAAQRLADAEAEALVVASQRQQQAAEDRVLGPVQNQVEELQRRLQAAPEGSPEQAVLTSEYQALLDRLAELEVDVGNRIDLVQPAVEPTSPVAPTPKRDAAVAFLVALVINAELMVLVEALAGRFRSDELETIRDVTGLPVLATVPRGERDATVEAFRRLRTSLTFSDAQQSLRTLAVVGLEEGCGKTTTSVGLARETARIGISVVLVDADLRRPEIHARLGLEAAPGFGDLGFGDDPWSVATSVGSGELTVIPAGTEVDDPGGRLSGGLASVLSQLRPAELIVIDTPPANPFADAYAVAAQCDGTIVVVDLARSRRRAVVRLVEELRRVGANPLGLVLNRVDAPTAADRYYAARRDTAGART